MTTAALDRVFTRLKEAEEHVLKARRIIRSLLECDPFDAESQADAFLKDTEEYEDA